MNVIRLPSTSGMFRRLKREARESCEFRGHAMEEFHTFRKSRLPDGRVRFVAQSNCKVCGMYVQVDTRPEPNGIDIGGEAVALNCKKF